MPLVVGLGNPGPDYAATRHNVGFRVVELLARRWSARPFRGDADVRVWRAAFGGREVTLLQPLGFMNVSGEVLSAWRERHGLEVAELLVVTDDVYLPVGALRLRGSGSSGGHRGLESIEVALGTQEYARLRIGVGAAPGAELKEHVLGEPSGEEREALERAVESGVEVVECWLEEGLTAAMNRFNRRIGKEVSES